MWKFCLIVFAIILWALPIEAQESDRRFIPKVQAGLFGSQVGGDGLSGFDKLNFAVGIGVATELDETFGLEMEINLAQKGSKRETDPDKTGTDQYKMDLLYIEVPVLFEYTYNDKLSGVIGPAAGVLLSAKETDYFGEIQDTPEFEPIEISLVIGGRYSLSDRFTAELRLDQSLLPIRVKGSTNFQRIEGQQFNTVLGIFISYSII